MKTGRAVALWLHCWRDPRASPSQKQLSRPLDDYGPARSVEAFQIADDLLDVEGDAAGARQAEPDRTAGN